MKLEAEEWRVDPLVHDNILDTWDAIIIFLTPEGRQVVPMGVIKFGMEYFMSNSSLWYMDVCMGPQNWKFYWSFVKYGLKYMYKSVSLVGHFGLR